MNTKFWGALSAVALFALALPVRSAPTVANGRRIFSESVRQIPSQAPGARTFLARTSLSVAEKAEVINFVISLQMPNFDELQAVLESGQRPSPAAMEQHFLPPISQYRAMQDWLRANGFTITQEDPAHTRIFARGTIGQTESALQTRFVRVHTPDGDFSSANTPASLPAEIAGSVLEISGLQPHRRMHVHSMQQNVTLIGGSIQGVFPGDIVNYYDAGTKQNGSGQTIAIIMDCGVNTSDLSQFFSTAGLTRSGSVTTVAVSGGGSNTSDALEAALDVEWAGGMALGANIRLYTIPSLTDANIISALTQIDSDASTYNITVTSMSFGGAEPDFYSSSYSAALATNAAAGITNLASSGDQGCYAPTGSSSYVQAAEYPASDPNVTGVGGTAMAVTGSGATYLYETLYSEVPTSGSDSSSSPKYATGGYPSAQFSIPTWQTASGSILTSQSHRCVPDVSAFWGTMPNQNQGWQGYAIVVLTSGGTQYYDGVGGTSLSSPIWAGIVARLNQARSGHSISAIGSLGPWVYLLANSASFVDITASNSNVLLVGSTWTTLGNSNGAYSTGTGYDFCTGLGRPDIAHFISVLEEASTGLFVVPPSTTILPSFLGGSRTVIKQTGYTTTP